MRKKRTEAFNALEAGWRFTSSLKWAGAVFGALTVLANAVGAIEAQPNDSLNHVPGMLRASPTVVGIRSSSTLNSIISVPSDCAGVTQMLHSAGLLSVASLVARSASGVGDTGEGSGLISLNSLGG